MESIDPKTISHNHLEQFVEQIRLAHERALKTHLHLHNRYKLFKVRFKDNEMVKCFNLFDQLLYDCTGKLDWENIRLLIPAGIEDSIKKEYDMLTVNEIRLCCLLLFNVPYDEIAEILPFTQKSAHTVAHRIKRRAGINNIKTCLKKFLMPSQ